MALTTGAMATQEGCPSVTAGRAAERQPGGDRSASPVIRATPAQRLWQPADMPDLREHAGRHYAVQFHYSLPDAAWCVELSEVVPASAAWTEVPNGATRLPGAALLVAVTPDGESDLEPTVHIHSHDEHVIPYEIVRWFMEQVADKVERCRAEPAQEGREAAG